MVGPMNNRTRVGACDATHVGDCDVSPIAMNREEKREWALSQIEQAQGRIESILSKPYQTSWAPFLSAIGALSSVCAVLLQLTDNLPTEIPLKEATNED